ncbi:MAG: N-acetylglucosamine-6-phosphate deacetylase [Myxococcota bacterium]
MPRTFFKNATLLDPEAAHPLSAGLLVEEGRIVAQIPTGQSEPTDAATIDLEGGHLAPGFVDLHYHGSLPLCDAASYQGALHASSASLIRSGTTAFLATTVAAPQAELTHDLTHLASLIGGSAHWPGAVPIGIHLEGPWISEAAAGAQPKRGIRRYRADEGAEVLATGADLIRLVTFAPELEGVAELQQALASENIPMAMGHSVATAEQARAATDRGASHVTHLFNAMGAMHHREPGLAGVALSDERLTCDLICDGVHVDPAIVKLVAKAKRDRLVLITDRLEICGATGRSASSSASSDASFSASSTASLGGEPVYDDGTALRLRDGRLAGSVLSLDAALRNARRFAGLSLLEAVAACTVRPALVIGAEADRGTLRPGARADLVLLDESGGVRDTWIGGISPLR